MDWLKKHIKSIKWAILIVAYAFLIYKLFHFKNYDCFFEQLTHASIKQWLYFILAICLLIPNILIESFKWKFLLKDIDRLTIRYALKSVLLGQIGAFTTPNRLGEYPSRALTLEKSKQLPAISMGLLGSVFQTLALATLGIIPAIMFFSGRHLIEPYRNYIFYVITIIITLIVIIAAIPNIFTKTRLRNNNRFERIRDALGKISLKDSSIILMLTLVRCLVFFTQLYLMFLFFDVIISPPIALIVIPTIYLFITITPSLPGSELGIRGFYAVWIVGFYSSNSAGIIFSSASLWFINVVTPLILGSLLVASSNVKH